MANFIIVDDSPYVHEFLTKTLFDAGHTLIGRAFDGESGYQLFLEKVDEIDFMTLDITMPKLDGVQTLRKIMEAASETNVIMVSGVGKESIIKQCIQMGAKNFIVKPFNKLQILKVVSNVLA